MKKQEPGTELPSPTLTHLAWAREHGPSPKPMPMIRGEGRRGKQTAEKRAAGERGLPHPRFMSGTRLPSFKETFLCRN